MSDVVISISAATGAAEAALNNFSHRVNEQFTDVAKKLTALFAAERLIEFGKRVIEGADNMGKFAQKTGVSTESLSAWTYSAKLANVEAGELQIGLKTAAQQLVSAADGAGQAAELFERLKVPVRDAHGEIRELDDVLLDAAERFSKMEDGARKTDLAVQLFGRSGASLIPLLNEGAAGLKKLKEEAAAAGVIIGEQTAKAAEQFNDNLTRMQQIAHGMALRLAVELLPKLIEVERWLLKNRDAVVSFSETIIKALAAAAVGWAAYRVAMLAGTTAGKTGIIVAGGATAATALNELWEEYKANKAITQTLEDQEKIVRSLRLRIQELVADLKDAGKLTGEQAANFVKLSASDSLDNLARLAEQVRKIAGFTSTKPKKTEEEFTNKEQLQNLKAENKLEELELDISYARKQIDLEQYLADKRTLIELGFDNEKDLAGHTKAELVALEKEKQAALTQADEEGRIARQERAKKDVADKVGDLENRIKEEELKRHAVETDSNSSATAKKEKIIPLLQEEIKLVAIELGLYAKLSVDQNGTEETRREALSEFIALQERQLDLNNRLRDSQRTSTDFPQLGATVGSNLKVDPKTGEQSMLDPYKALDSFLNTTLNTTFQGINDSIQGMIDGSRTWGQVMVGVLDSMLSGFINLILEYTLFHQIRMLLDKVFNVTRIAGITTVAAAGATATAATTATSTTAAAATTTAWTPAAIMASIASMGVAGWIGLAVVLAAVGYGLSQAFSEGGPVNGPGSGTSDSIPSRLSNGEFVIRAAAVKKFGSGFFADLNAGVLNAHALAGALPGSLARPVTSDPQAMQQLADQAAAASGGAGGGGGNIHVAPAPVYVVTLNSEAELRRFLESKANERIIYTHTSNLKNELGIPS